MDGLICEACGDLGVRDLPSRDELNPFPCPCCRPDGWPRGFPGESVVRNGERRWIIEPSEPGEPARYVGHQSST